VDRGGGNNFCISDMHKTESLDFGIVLEGERILVCDEGRTTIVPGDIVVQGGAWHLWDSSAKGCHMAFDMFSADFSPETARTAWWSRSCPPCSRPPACGCRGRAAAAARGHHRPRAGPLAHRQRRALARRAAGPGAPGLCAAAHLGGRAPPRADGHRVAASCRTC
jgi:hypothetical protein